LCSKKKKSTYKGVFCEAVSFGETYVFFLVLDEVVIY